MKNTFDGQSIRNLTKNAKITYKANLYQFILDSIVDKVREEATKRFGEKVEVDCIELAKIYHKEHPNISSNESLLEEAIQEVVTVLRNADFDVIDDRINSMGNIIISWSDVEDEDLGKEEEE